MSSKQLSAATAKAVALPAGYAGIHGGKVEVLASGRYAMLDDGMGFSLAPLAAGAGASPRAISGCDYARGRSVLGIREQRGLTI